MAENAKYLKPDNKGRIQLGKLAKDVVRYRVVAEIDGTIKLYPEVAVPLNEVWLYKNKESLNCVIEGFEQSKNGETLKRGSFAQYIEEE